MGDLVKKTLELALAQDKPVVICYMGKDGFTQRRVYVRKIGSDKVAAYCMARRGLRYFAAEGILSAQIVEE